MEPPQPSYTRTTTTASPTYTRTTTTASHTDTTTGAYATTYYPIEETTTAIWTEIPPATTTTISTYDDIEIVDFGDGRWQINGCPERKEVKIRFRSDDYTNLTFYTEYEQDGWADINECERNDEGMFEFSVHNYSYSDHLVVYIKDVDPSLIEFVDCRRV